MSKGGVIGFAVLTLALAVTAGVLATTWPDSSVEPWSGPPKISSDERAVRVTVHGAGCSHPEAEVVETDERVRITVRVVRDWFVLACHDALIQHSVVVDLGAPLGERELVDGAA